MGRSAGGTGGASMVDPQEMEGGKRRHNRQLQDLCRNNRSADRLHDVRTGVCIYLRLQHSAGGHPGYTGVRGDASVLEKGGYIRTYKGPHSADRGTDTAGSHGCDMHSVCDRIFRRHGTFSEGCERGHHGSESQLCRCSGSHV